MIFVINWICWLINGLIYWLNCSCDVQYAYFILLICMLRVLVLSFINSHFHFRSLILLSHALDHLIEQIQCNLLVFRLFPSALKSAVDLLPNDLIRFSVLFSLCLTILGNILLKVIGLLDILTNFKR